ncbi:MAG: hypothetical protein WCT33_02485 [Patescibacteria group bacterium]|jgi:hypothetical protein
MEEEKKEVSYLKGDLITLLVVVILFTVILTALVYLDTNTEIITDLGKKIAGAVIK